MSGFRGHKFWPLIFIISYLFFFLRGIPAERVYAYLVGRTNIPARQLSVAGIDGTWLAGRLLGARVWGVECGDLTWEIRPLALLLGRLEVRINGRSRSLDISGVARITRDSMGISGLTGSISAGLLSEFPALKSLSLAGKLTAENFSIILKEGLPVGGGGALVWREAAIKAPYDLKLGGIKALVGEERGQIVVKFSDTGGGLLAAGTCNVKPDGSYSLSGSVGARTGASSDLATFMQVLGEPGSDGRIRLSFKGQLPQIGW